jgi:hypothetical protein
MDNVVGTISVLLWQLLKVSHSMHCIIIHAQRIRALGMHLSNADYSRMLFSYKSVLDALILGLKYDNSLSYCLAGNVEDPLAHSKLRFPPVAINFISVSLFSQTHHTVTISKVSSSYA